MNPQKKHRRGYRVRPWSAGEEDWLRRNYARFGTKKKARILGRTDAAVRSRERLLGLYLASGEDGTLAIPDLARRWGVRDRTLRDWLAAGHLKQAQGYETLRVAVPEVERFEREHQERLERVRAGGERVAEAARRAWATRRAKGVAA